MNTKLIAGIVALGILAGGAYYFMNGSSTGADVTGDAPKGGAEAGAFKGSMAALMERGGNWKCTVDSSANTGAGTALSSGVVYVSGNKVRADFTSTVQGFGNVESHMIADGESVYSWSSMMPQGFKLPQTQMTGEGGTETSGSGFDANQSYAYDCQPSSAQASLFTAPANITFTELSF